MYLADRLRRIREFKKLSQGDMENRSGLRRCYISRVENGHTVPAVETLEKMARALEVPLYQLFIESGPASNTLPLHKRKKEDWASRGKGSRLFGKIRQATSRVDGQDRVLLLDFAAKMSKSAGRHVRAF
jgi:transcriptional regulator with XRE-family HTH domain